MGTFYFSGVFRGRPRGRSVDSRPKRRAVRCCQVSLPKGLPRSMLVRTAANSSLVFVGYQTNQFRQRGS
jgi:hypothetical protein